MRLACDCGVVIEADNAEKFVARAQAHALETHSMRFSADQILALAAGDGRHGTTFRSARPDHEPPA